MRLSDLWEKNVIRFWWMIKFLKDPVEIASYSGERFIMQIDDGCSATKTQEKLSKRMGVKWRTQVEQGE